MAKPMTAQEAHAALDGVAAAMAAQFGQHPDRVAQLSAALATAGMAADHLFDEELRRVDNTERREARIRAELGG